MSSVGHKLHKPEVDLYKRIAAAINPRLDLSTTQKTEIIKSCYEAAKLLPAENGLPTPPIATNHWEKMGQGLSAWINKRKP